MDNNFNQPNNNNQNNMFDSNLNNGINNNVDYNMGVVSQKPNIFMGILGALAGALIGAFVWILISKTGYIFGILGMGIMWLTMFLYEKLAKGINIVGVIICIVFTLAAIYAGNRIGAVLMIQNEFANNGIDISLSRSNELFKITYNNDDTYRSAYFQDLITSYIFSIACSVVLIVNNIKKRK